MNIKGKVQAGRKIGRTIGFPTVNLAYSGDLRGVFVGMVAFKKVYAEIELGAGVGVAVGIDAETNATEGWHKAVVHLGGRPTFDDNEIVCEAFLIDWHGKFFSGTEVEIEIFDKIRDIKKFKNSEELKLKISRDVEFVKNWYNESESKQRI